jgi:hypothetical protein
VVFGWLPPKLYEGSFMKYWIKIGNCKYCSAELGRTTNGGDYEGPLQWRHSNDIGCHHVVDGCEFDDFDDSPTRLFSEFYKDYFIEGKDIING